MSGSRSDAVAAVDEACPRCGAPREPDQEFCLECGFQLPPSQGGIPALRRRWLSRIGWYPGDWIWMSLLTLLVAAVGAGVAIAATSSDNSGGSATIVPPKPVTTTIAAPATTIQLTTTHAATTTTATVTHPATTRPAATTTAPAVTTTVTVPSGQVTWPAGQDGWTNVLISYPTSGGTAVPKAAALRAAARGLPQVGVLDSSGYASLHPGYYVVFSGVYSTSEEANAALASAHAAGFAGAYTRQIAN